MDFLFDLMTDIPYKYQDDDVKINRNIIFLQHRNERYNIAQYNQMPKDYNIENLIFDLKCLSEGVGAGQVDTVGTNLNNILLYLGEFYELIDPMDITSQILNAFNESGFMVNAIEILKNDTKVQDIIFLLEILCRIFELISNIQDDEAEEQIHPLQSQITDDLLSKITDIVIDPKSILPEERRNTFVFGDVSLTKLYDTVDDIPTEQYECIINLGIAAISNLCSNSNDLMNFTYIKICPILYDTFIKNGNGNADTIFEIVKLFLVIITFFNYEFLVDELKPFIALFITELNVDEEICLQSIRGICVCMERNTGIADEFPKTSLFEQINILLEYDNEEIQNDTLILITKIFHHASKDIKKELAKYVNWDLIKSIGFNHQYMKARYTLCKAIPEIINYAPFMLDVVFSSQIIYTIISLIINSSFELKKQALHSFLQIIPIISATQLSDLLENEDLISDFVKTLNEFLVEVDDNTTIRILDTLSYIFQVGTETNIIKKLNRQNFFEEIEQNAYCLQDADNEELQLKAIDFIEKLNNCRRELEEEDEVGYTE